MRKNVFSQLSNILTPNESFPAQIMVKSSLYTIRKILDVLEEYVRMQFKRSCFFHFAELDTQMTGDPQKKARFSMQLVHYMLFKRAACKKSMVLWFNFDEKPTWFSIYEFSIVTGLACGQNPLELRDTATKFCLWAPTSR